MVGPLKNLLVSSQTFRSTISCRNLMNYMTRVYVSAEPASIRNVFEVMTFYRYKDEDRAKVEAQIAGGNIPEKAFFYFNIPLRTVQLLDITKERLDEKCKARDEVETALGRRRERIMTASSEIYATLIDNEKQRSTAVLLTKFLLGRLAAATDPDDLSVSVGGKRGEATRLSLIDYVCSLVSPALAQQVGKTKKAELQAFHSHLRRSNIILPSVMVLNRGFFADDTKDESSN